jgi:ubiquinone/menaquinone biosynthesis C-methylase UbiE
MNSYDLFAKLYDLEHEDLCEDITLYLNYAVRCGGPVLELGCGSGRVSLALAGPDLSVTGIDTSAEMLELARAHAADAGLSNRVRFQQIDVRELEFEDEFSLALYPLNGFLHLQTAEDQLGALCGIHRALLPGGLLIVDLPNAHTVFAPATDGQLLLRRRFHSPEGHDISSSTVTETDLASQTQHMTLIYDQVGADRLLQRVVVEMDLRFVYRFEMAHLLYRAGFTVDGVYGSYDLEPYEDDSASMLFVAHT